MVLDGDLTDIPLTVLDGDPLDLIYCATELVQLDGITLLPIYFLDPTGSATIEIPTYEPWPKCGFSMKDVTYSMVEGSGIPDWVTFDDDKRTVSIRKEPSDKQLLGTSITLQFIVNFNQLNHLISFKVSFSTLKTAGQDLEVLIE